MGRTTRGSVAFRLAASTECTLKECKRPSLKEGNIFESEFAPRCALAGCLSMAIGCLAIIGVVAGGVRGFRGLSALDTRGLLKDVPLVATPSSPSSSSGLRHTSGSVRLFPGDRAGKA
uniref:Uncharacterized protein n=1 Tax=Tetraselmis chuii TaxID=63592 RepID=A0A7S1WYV2_9CHLO|mmetsp:Transcript_1294/g.2292  ORF Transcript_1294/g.2292 Transcript_1294/m.2292 type:complete len:118 (+) Transcript_1294:454-807(+)|eukprot:CAMPEP_0177754898 /NCGR_PEP_ID=MMETSP0491_2-20121128/2261_1 /TAXON_ID=63592 /ORGANISM="Tetraselmis chuii, Strain PLY429" /LENGTH=117 /DNA_ID=CAMNT_0019270325 /DNA_START=412 /DNA_END=765 /DNA_ORIENTATION=-